MDVRWCKVFFWSEYYGGILVKSVYCFLFMYTVYGCLLYSASVCMYYWRPESGWVRSVYVIPRWWLNVVYKCLDASRHTDLCFLSSWGKCGFQNRAVVWLYPDHTGDSSFSPFLMANGECNRLATQFLDQHDESAECVAVYRVKSPEWGSAALMLFSARSAIRIVWRRPVGWKRLGEAKKTQQSVFLVYTCDMHHFTSLHLLMVAWLLWHDAIGYDAWRGPGLPEILKYSVLQNSSNTQDAKRFARDCRVAFGLLKYHMFAYIIVCISRTSSSMICIDCIYFYPRGWHFWN